MTKETIGFIGAGLMGGGMAKNILAAGFPLAVIAHRSRTRVDALVAAGAQEVSDLTQMARTASIIHICAPGSPQVEAIVDALLPHLATDSVIVDCSTSDPTSTEALAAKLEAADCHMVDAPLGGTPAQAEDGALAAMVGASPDVFARVAPVLESWSAKIDHLGPVGAGHKMKLINNFLSIGYGAIYSEALVLANKVGLDTKTVDSVIRGSRMDCGFYQTFMGYALEGNRDSHKFTLTNALKDMRYLAAMADAAGIANPMGNAVKNSVAQAVNAGGDGPKDYVPHMVDFIAHINGAARKD